MESRKTTMHALRRHLRASEHESLKRQMKQAGLAEDVRVAGPAAPAEEEDEGPTRRSTTMRRVIPKDYDYDPRALKPLARMLWALSISLGHVMTAHRQFTKLKSGTISPDGLIGGRGYVMSVKDVRGSLHDACEAISSVSDTIHDELHAPHWRPKLAELEGGDIESVERLVGDAERVLENPEDESFVEDGLNKAEEGGEQAKMEQDEVKTTDSRFESNPGGFTEDGEEAGDEDDEDDEDDDDEDDDDDDDGSELPDAKDAADSESGKVKTASRSESMLERISRRYANSSLPVEIMPGGPRVEHLDRGDADQTEPFGSYSSDAPRSGYGVEDYLYESEWDPTLLKSAQSRVPDDITDTTPTDGWDFGIGYAEGNDAHGQGAGGYGPKDSDGKGVYGPSSKIPSDPGGKLHDDESDTTPAIEMEMGRSNRMASRAQSHLPNDGQPPVARSDYYRGGDKGSNPVNVGQSVGTSELPAEPEVSYDYSMDVQPGLGYRHEQDQPYVKWDYSTHNMRPDNLHQRDDEGPYVKQEG